jgi:hypothetical protein
MVEKIQLHGHGSAVLFKVVYQLLLLDIFVPNGEFSIISRVHKCGATASAEVVLAWVAISIATHIFCRSPLVPIENSALKLLMTKTYIAIF